MAKRTKTRIKKRIWDITLVAVLMILLGMAELLTSFTHAFFSIFTAVDISSTYTALIIGVLYVASGLLILTMKKQAVALSIVFISVVIAVRISMALTGLYLTGLSTTHHVFRTAVILIDTAIAVIFAVYIWFKRDEFD